MRRSLATALLLSALAGACGGPDHGTLVGDVYFALDVGGEVNFRNTPVLLLPDDEKMDSTLAVVCAQRDQELAGLRGTQAQEEQRAAATEAAQRAAWKRRAQILEPRVQRRTRTDSAATFVFDSVPQGRYQLWANATVGDQRWSWLLPVVVRSGDTTRANLSNSNVDDDPFRCYWDPRKEGFLFN